LGIGDWAQSPIPNPQSPILSKLVIAIAIQLKINILLNLFKHYF